MEIFNMKLSLDVCNFAANRAGMAKPWGTILSHAESVKVNVYENKVAVKVTMGGETRKLTVERHGHGDYRIHHYGDLQHADKDLLKLFGADKKVLCKIGEEFIKFYRKQQ
jgi:hypothetical protein